jgi:nucleoside-diphosphate-sugar epimerase
MDVATAIRTRRSIRRYKRKVIPDEVLAEIRARQHVLSVDRAREVLGFEAQIGLEPGMAETAKWYRENGWV